MLKEVLLFIFILSFLVQLYYYLNYFLLLARPVSKVIVEVEFPISIVIATKNEVENLKNYLMSILNQDYGTFEVVLIDDHSIDGTLEYLRSIKSDRLKFYQLEKEVGKKAAIQLGIDKAGNKHLVFIDADCKPASESWLKEMASKFNDDKQIVLGYGRFFKRDGFLNKIIRFEGLINAIQYFSFALAGKPYMGVGRNLAYTKSIYHNSKSFDVHSKLRSGDDDLLINEMATGSNTAISVNPNSHTITCAKESWIAYSTQRRRQLQAGERYQFKDRIRLMLFGLSNTLFYILYIILMLDEGNYFFYSLLFVSKLIIQIIIFKKIMANLGDKDLLRWIPVLEFIYLLQIILIGVSTWIWKVNRWK